MEVFPNYYSILGVSPDADIEEIRHAYRQLARRYHPDLNPRSPTAELRMRTINKAYEVLSEPHKRAQYDAQLQAFLRRKKGERTPSPISKQHSEKFTLFESGLEFVEKGIRFRRPGLVFAGIAVFAFDFVGRYKRWW